MRTDREGKLARHFALKIGGLGDRFEQQADTQRRRAPCQHTLEVVPVDRCSQYKLALHARLEGHDLLGHLAEPGRQDRSDVPGGREDGSVLLLVRFEHASEPREPTRNVVELAGFGGGAKDAAIVAKEEERVPFQEGVPGSMEVESAISETSRDARELTWRPRPKHRRQGTRR